MASEIRVNDIKNRSGLGTVTFTDTGLLISGITSFSLGNTNLIVGSATSTGTASQTLQVTGGGYVSGNVGIGSTIPSSTLAVGGTITELSNGTYWNIVTQADVGIGASQVPLNQYLGKMAYVDRVGNIGVSSAPPVNNLEVNFEFVSNTSIRVRMRGTDGVVRSSTLTLS